MELWLSIWRSRPNKDFEETRVNDTISKAEPARSVAARTTSVRAMITVTLAPPRYSVVCSESTSWILCWTWCSHFRWIERRRPTLIFLSDSVYLFVYSEGEAH